MSILIINGKLIDPSQNISSNKDILIEGKKIKGIYSKGKGPKADKVIDASDCIVMPGFVDMHTHLREPGFEYKETISTGTMAAARGGFTSVCCMPNTNPVNDTISVAEFILKKAAKEGSCSVYPIAAITKGQSGETLTELEALINVGCVAFSDDGRPVMNSLIMRRALEYSRIFDVPVIAHCEDLMLSEGGVMNEGLMSTTLGLHGIPRAAEEVMVARDIALCELTGGRLHIAHVSSRGSVSMIRDAKSRGINLTAETCPHYFTLTDESLNGYDTNFKVNPPIRTAADVQAIKEGLKDGTIDVIATDHAPHHYDEKNCEFDKAAFGISGLETAFSLGLRLVNEKVIDLMQLITMMSVTPSKIMRINKGTLAEGADADITIVDLNRTYKIDSAKFLSKGKNTPFNGWELNGVVMKTITMGKVQEWE
ncbi:MAG: dihydroorotase [Thermodesulfovibrionia bacterium]|nr:dihydroorotase [Thermodesulfovibrionia bacterium]